MFVRSFGETRDAPILDSTNNTSGSEDHVASCASDSIGKISEVFLNQGEILEDGGVLFDFL